MKKVFYTIATWFKSMFAKKQKEETKFPEIGSFDDSHIQEFYKSNSNENLSNKQILKEWAKSNNDKVQQEDEHKMVLSQTVRSEKPNKYSKNKYVVHMGDKKFSLTAKQDFFLTEIKILEDINKDANINDVVVAFLNLKYQNSQMTPTQDELKPAYHKKTINYLVKCGAIKSTSKNHYRTNF